MGDSAFTARMFTLRPFGDIHVTSLLLHHVAVFLYGLSRARAQSLGRHTLATCQRTWTMCADSEIYVRPLS